MAATEYSNLIHLKMCCVVCKVFIFYTHLAKIKEKKACDVYGHLGASGAKVMVMSW